MKKSINLFIFLSLFINSSIGGQVDQNIHFLAVENNLTPNNLFKGFVEIEVGITFELEEELIVTEEMKKYAYNELNMFKDFPSLLDKKPSLERAISLKGTPQNGPRPIHAVDFQHQEVKPLIIKYTTPSLNINRKSKSFGPVYEF